MSQFYQFQPSRYLRFITILLILFVTVFVTACGAPTGTKEPSAEVLLPNLSDYNAADTVDVQDTITKFAGAASLSTGNAEITALLAGVNSLTSCYQKAGAIAGRTYVSKAEPLKAGVVFIVNRNLITDPTLFLSCVSPQRGMRAQSAEPTPCTKAYTLKKNNNEYYIAYAATYAEVCTTFCSNLESCTP